MALLGIRVRVRVSSRPIARAKVARLGKMTIAIATSVADNSRKSSFLENQTFVSINAKNLTV